MNTHDSADLSNRQLVVSRVYDAPRELVFRAFTDPKNIGLWWGPNGFRTTIQEMDVRPGGIWRFIMHGPDGTDYDNLVTYQEVTPPARLIYSHGDGHPGDPGEFHVTATFDELAATGQPGKTKLTLTLLFKSTEECQKMRDFGAVEGGTQTLGRLAEYLQSM